MVLPKLIDQQIIVINLDIIINEVRVNLVHVLIVHSLLLIDAFFIIGACCCKKELCLFISGINSKDHFTFAI